MNPQVCRWGHAVFIGNIHELQCGRGHCARRWQHGGGSLDRLLDWTMVELGRRSNVPNAFVSDNGKNAGVN